jgi:hypothetical protein
MAAGMDIGTIIMAENTTVEGTGTDTTTDRIAMDMLTVGKHTNALNMTT